MPETGRSPETVIKDAPLLERFYLPFLLEAQNADGGWGYRPGGQSSVEVTSWALLALLTPRILESSTSRLLECVRWLRERQLEDGSWPSFAGQPRGCWATALASLALYARGDSLEQVSRGLHWLAKTWPAEGGFWHRLGAKTRQRNRVIRQDPSLRGWSWTPGTASWVEPTSYALIAFRHIPKGLHPRAAGRHRQLAERMLYDRMCPGGGWNSGNPLVYGAAGAPRIGPTVWALLALREYRDRPENRRSLDWLEQAYSQIQGPGSLALAHLCLEFHGRSVPPLEPRLAELNSNSHFLSNTLVAAWAAIALSGRPRWLASETRNSKLETRKSKIDTGD